MEKQKTYLTGIKPSGTAHLGNYLGMMKPALQIARDNPDARCLYFIADYHALTTVEDPEVFRKLTYEVVAGWLALGLDPERVLFYRQSDIPEVFELTWVLACVTPKGLMNRAHAYKAAVAENQQKGEADLDAGVNMGLYNYPVLMAADILLFETDVVPVGEDQVQHVEISRDIAGSFNYQFGDVLTLPEHEVRAGVGTVPGLDGRKMSKSYDNVIPLFASCDELRDRVLKIKTDSSPPDAPKDPEGSIIFALYRQFATPEQTEAMRVRYANGIGWADAKRELFQLLDEKLSGPRERYNKLIADTEKLDAVLADGARKARALARPLMERVREAIGRP